MPKGMIEGYDDCRPNSGRKAPGKTDCTSEGARKGYKPDEGNVTPNQTKDSVGSGWKGLQDSRPDSNGSRQY